MDETSSQSSAPTSVHTPTSSISTTPSTPISELAKDTFPAGAPESPLFEIRDTPNAGRAVFATQNIPRDTLLWRADDLALSVILREYRREVCGQCFRYDRGRDLDVRDKNVGFAYCSATCRDTWGREVGDIGVQAWTAVEKLVKNRSKEDSEMVDADLPRPQTPEIKLAWEATKIQANLIRSARDNPKPTKAQNKALQKALQAPLSPDTLSFCTSGLLWRHTHPTSWPNLTSLAYDPTPYHSTDDLTAFTRTYLHLLAILPSPLLIHLTPDTIFQLSARDSHNAFGIRSLDDEGCEFFGYGCWPGASYFNHSCAPNVAKRREGREWVFCVGEDRDVVAGEELQISYLSGEERGWKRDVRRATLAKNWGFECACWKCGEEVGGEVDG